MVANNFVWMRGGIKQCFSPFFEGYALDKSRLDLFLELLRGSCEAKPNGVGSASGNFFHLPECGEGLIADLFTLTTESLNKWLNRFFSNFN